MTAYIATIIAVIVEEFRLYVLKTTGILVGKKDFFDFVLEQGYLSPEIYDEVMLILESK